MEQAQTLMTQVDGKQEMWYSPEYLRIQTEMAYSSGIMEGIPIDLHIFVANANEETVHKVYNLLKEKLSEVHRNSHRHTRGLKINKV